MNNQQTTSVQASQLQTTPLANTTPLELMEILAGGILNSDQTKLAELLIKKHALLQELENINRLIYFKQRDIIKLENFLKLD
jgi:hypothetical protein